VSTFRPLVIRSLATALVLVVLAAACADDADQAIPATTPTAAPSSEPTPSEGCTSSPVALAGESVETLTVQDMEREYLRHLPPAHDGTAPVPVVVDFHGVAEGAAIHAQHSALALFGDEKGFVTITPEGQGAVPFWDFGSGSVDLAFVGALLDEIEQDLCLDTDRIFVAGLSNGAFMVSAAACAFSDRIAAVAAAAGVIDPDGCAFTRPVPLIAFHGTDDQFVSYDGGLGPAGELLGDGGPADIPPEAETVLAAIGSQPVPAMTAAWATRNGCATPPEEEVVAADVTLLAFECPDGAATRLYRVDAGGHSWPGSTFSAQIEDVVGSTTFSIDANELMWAFFEGHPLT
jgi:polyhydroxybutyrate depolymerase